MLTGYAGYDVWLFSLGMVIVYNSWLDMLAIIAGWLCWLAFCVG
jgi:hypothetical protein